MSKPVLFSLILSFFLLFTATNTIATTDVFASTLSNDFLEGQNTPSQRNTEVVEQSITSVPFRLLSQDLDFNPRNPIQVGTELVRRVDKRMGLPWFGLWVFRTSVEDLFLNVFFGEQT